MQAPLLDRDSLLRRYGDSTAIPEHLDSAAAPLLHPDDPANHHMAAPAQAMPPLSGRRSVRLWAAVALFVGVAALYAAFVGLIRWHLGLPWPWDAARDVPAAASLQTVTVAAALGSEALMQSAWPWTCRPLLARNRRRGSLLCGVSDLLTTSADTRCLETGNRLHALLYRQTRLPLTVFTVPPDESSAVWGLPHEADRLVAAPLHIAAISTGATLAVVLWVPPGPSAPRIATLLLLIAVMQLLAAVAWVAATCYDSRRQEPGAATDGGRQLQSSWRAMERLELWTLPAAQFDSIIAAGTAEAALARESEARALSEAASLRREAITAWKQVEERQQALQALETIQKAAVAENARLRASLQEWSLANARLERQLQESLQLAAVP